MTGVKNWRGRPGRRLALNMLLAALLLAGAASVLRYPAYVPPAGLLELQVQIVDFELAVPEILPEPIPPAEPSDPAMESVAELARRTEAGVRSADTPEPPVDWQALRDAAVQGAVRDKLQTYSVNPGFEQQREFAALQFRASQAPEKRFIWDNVQKDYLGRTILVHGDCFRVLDDPSAVYRDIFETFTQYLVFCAGGSPAGRELPWVAEVRAQHGYLQRQLDESKGVLF